MKQRDVVMRGGPYDGMRLDVTVPTIELAGPDEWDGQSPIEVHTYSVQCAEDGSYFGRYDGWRRA
jgi:hypothetical protein